MNIREFFEKVGGDYDNALQRLSSERILVKFIRKFADEPSYSQLKKALSENNLEEAFRAAHTLKGASSTLGLENLRLAASALTESLRGAEKIPSDDLVAATDEAYSLVVGYIAALD